MRQEEMLLSVDNSVILAFLLASSWAPPPPQVAKNGPFSHLDAAGFANELGTLAQLVTA